MKQVERESSNQHRNPGPRPSSPSAPADPTRHRLKYTRHLVAPSSGESAQEERRSQKKKKTKKMARKPRAPSTPSSASEDDSTISTVSVLPSPGDFLIFFRTNRGSGPENSVASIEQARSLLFIQLQGDGLLRRAISRFTSNNGVYVV